jgi:BCD family chlorophyll transporter-like MFS transporter
MSAAAASPAGSAPRAGAALGWTGIVRLGLVQAALGAVVVIVTSTLNRVMVVEYALPALLPGALVALHYAVQMIRPRFGHASDRGGRRTPWIIGGMALLAAGGIACAAATVGIRSHPLWALPLAVLAYAMVGLGVGSAGTSVLVLLAVHVEARRRAAAATIMWVLMVAGFAVTATTVGRFLDPFSPARLIEVTAVAAACAFAVAVAAVWRVEAQRLPQEQVVPRSQAAAATLTFGQALRRVWSEPQSRRFTLFVFMSMLAYSAQELILEPFSGLVFHYTLGQSTSLSGLQHAAVFLGMICVGLACSGPRRLGTLRGWTVGGCCASALALFGLAAADWVGPAAPLRVCVFALGVSNGVFAVAAIGSMMDLAQDGRPGHAGVRMGLWGAAQAVAFAVGGVFGTSIVDAMRFLLGSTAMAFAIVFVAEAILFLLAAGCAARIRSTQQRHPAPSTTAVTA